MSDIATIDGAKWHRQQAEATMNSLNYSSGFSERKLADKIADMHLMAAGAIEILPAYADRIAALEFALERISSRSQTDNLLWWQIEARKALDDKSPQSRLAFNRGDLVRKKSGSWWEGRVVGFYSTGQTPDGLCVQQQGDHPNMPVQIFPAAALEPKP